MPNQVVHLLFLFFLVEFASASCTEPTNNVVMRPARFIYYNACQLGTIPVRQEQCKEAVLGLLPDGVVQGRDYLVVGNFDEAPPGCSVKNGGDWAAIFNLNANGQNNGDFAPLCDPISYLAPEGGQGCPVTSRSPPQGDCLRTAALFLAASPPVMSLVVDSWTDRPTGCSVTAAGEVSFNLDPSGGNCGDFFPVCTPLASLASQGANECPAGSGLSSPSEEQCLAAAHDLLPSFLSPGRDDLVSGSWGNVPPGCSVQTGGDWAAHWNSNSEGANDGRYSVLCQAPRYEEPFAGGECTTAEPYSADTFALMSEDGDWGCGICGDRPILGFEFTVPDHIVHIAIGLNRASQACLSPSWHMDHAFVLRGQWGGGQMESYDLASGQRGKKLGQYEASDTFGVGVRDQTVYFLQNGLVVNERPRVLGVDYNFDYSIYTLASGEGPDVNVSFVDPFRRLGCYCEGLLSVGDRVQIRAGSSTEAGPTGVALGEGAAGTVVCASGQREQGLFVAFDGVSEGDGWTGKSFCLRDTGCGTPLSGLLGHWLSCEDVDLL